MPTLAEVQNSPELWKQGDDIMHGLLGRSATDPEFRKKLLTDSRAALAEYTGKEVKGPFNVVFVENKAQQTVVLPDPVDPAAELSQQELESVAGGSTPFCSAATIIASCLAIINAIVD
jgi:hypothetical protein